MKKSFIKPIMKISRFLDAVALSASSPDTTAVTSVRSQLNGKQIELNIEKVNDVLKF